MTSTSAPTAAGQQRGREVLVDDGLDAAQRAVGVAHDRDAAAAGADDDVPRVAQRRDGRRVEDLERLRRGDDPAPARAPRSSQVWPCSISGARLVLAAGSGRSAWSGWAKPGSSPSTRVRVTSVADRRSTPRSASAWSSASRMRKPIVPWVCAPHQSSGTGGTTCRGELVLHQQVADLRAVAVGEHDLDAGRDQVGDVLHRRARPRGPGPAAVALPSGPVMALPPRAMSARTRWTLAGRIAVRLRATSVTDTPYDRWSQSHGAAVASGASPRRRRASRAPTRRAGPGSAAPGGSAASCAVEAQRRSGQRERPAVACSTSTSSPCDRVWSQLVDPVEGAHLAGRDPDARPAAGSRSASGCVGERRVDRGDDRVAVAHPLGVASRSRARRRAGRTRSPAGATGPRCRPRSAPARPRSGTGRRGRSTGGGCPARAAPRRRPCSACPGRRARRRSRPAARCARRCPRPVASRSCSAATTP